MSNVQWIRGTVLLLGPLWLADVARAAEQVVLESSSARLTAGETVDADREIALAMDEFVVFATEDGRLVRLEGPYSGPAAGRDAGAPASASNVRRALEQLFGLRPAEAGGLAGVRGDAEEGADAADSRPDPWWIHAERMGDQCVVDGARVRVWREPTAQSATAEIEDLARGATAPLRWREREAGADWPFDSAPADGGIYLVRPEGELRSVPIKLHALAPGLADKGLATVAWLAARGCLPQARLMLRMEGGDRG